MNYLKSLKFNNLNNAYNARHGYVFDKVRRDIYIYMLYSIDTPQTDSMLAAALSLSVEAVHDAIETMARDSHISYIDQDGTSTEKFTLTDTGKTRANSLANDYNGWFERIASSTFTLYEKEQFNALYDRLCETAKKIDDEERASKPKPAAKTNGKKVLAAIALLLIAIFALYTFVPQIGDAINNVIKTIKDIVNV